MAPVHGEFMSCEGSGDEGLLLSTRKHRDDPVLSQIVKHTVMLQQQQQHHHH